ncbi:MAG: hypothetical protein EA411_02860 [Saprospirales bacterium]|nr:MAG: hypothetical protein EA411_02860 [Saprospirales bacterium]
MQILFTILLSLTVTFNAVSQISGKVFDQKTGNPLYGVVLTSEEGEIVSITDRDGLFALPENGGSFVLRALGYRDTTIGISNGDDTDFWGIGLIPKTYELPEVLISDKHPESKIFGLDKRRLRSFSIFSFGPRVGGSLTIGTMLRNQNSGVISSVSVYFTEVGIRTNYQLLRLRIFEINSEGEPGSDLLRSLVVLRPQETGWYDIDLNEFHVPLPGTDFLVAVEFIQRRYDESDIKSERYGNAFDLGFTKVRRRERSEVGFWLKTNQGLWRNQSWPSVPLIRVEAIIDTRD